MEAIICPAWSRAMNLHSKEGREAFTSEKVASVLTQICWKQAGIRVRNISLDAVLCSCSVVRVVMWRDRAIPASRTRSQRASWSGNDRFSPWLIACWYFAVQVARAREAPATKVWSRCVVCHHIQGGSYQGSDIFCSRLIATCHGHHQLLQPGEQTSVVFQAVDGILFRTCSLCQGGRTKESGLCALLYS